MIRVALHTLGCRTNQADTASIRSELERLGADIEFVPWTEVADVYAINTCTVTVRADRDGRKRIRGAARRAPGAAVVVYGCYAEAAADLLAELPGVSAVLGNRHRAEVARAILDAAARVPAPRVRTGGMEQATTVETHRVDRYPDRVRAMLKIQEGCDRRCAYCVVPAVRGPSRSLPAPSVVRDAHRLAAAGHPEIVLTGTHTAGWGHDLEPQHGLAWLLELLLDEIPGVRFRISSVDPEEITGPLVSLLAGHDRICRHLHLAIQHGDAGVLRAMRRASSPASIRDAVERLAGEVPGVAIGADVIAGYPAEDAAAFERSRELLASLPLAYLHVFGFSARPGTPAAAMSPLPRGEIAARVSALRDWSEGTLRPRFLHRLVGHPVEVAVERSAGAGRLRGTSSEFATVELPGDGGRIGQLAVATVARVEGAVCHAEPPAPGARMGP